MDESVGNYLFLEPIEPDLKRFRPEEWKINIEFERNAMGHGVIAISVGHAEDGPKYFPNNKEAMDKILIYAIRRLSEELEWRNK